MCDRYARLYVRDELDLQWMRRGGVGTNLTPVTLSRCHALERPIYLSKLSTGLSDQSDRICIPQGRQNVRQNVESSPVFAFGFATRIAESVWKLKKRMPFRLPTAGASPNRPVTPNSSFIYSTSIPSTSSKPDYLPKCTQLCIQLLRSSIRLRQAVIRAVIPTVESLIMDSAGQRSKLCSIDIMHY